ncbi:MAG: M15 family metallopeptidase [Alphaproteobacteria bacterium]
MHAAAAGGRSWPRRRGFAARGLSLLVFDCYRPARAARAFLRWAEAPGGEAMKAEFFPRVAKRDLIRLGYVAARSDHSRGIAVDVALMPAEARVPRPESAPPPADCAAPPALRYPDGALDFGTGFDCFDARAHAGAPGLNAEAAANHRLLAETLHRHGFVGYAREWWHFRFAAGAAAAPVRDFVLRCPRGFFAEPGTRICRPIR